MQLNQNVATADRILRFVLAASLIGLAMIGIPGTPFAWATVAVAVLFVLTAITGFCPLYAVLRVSTHAAHR